MTNKEFGEKLLAFLFSNSKEPEKFLRLSLLNYLGTVYSGSKEEAVSILVKALQKEGTGKDNPIGRREHMSLSNCLLTDCYCSSVQAYDDIHFATSTHPCGPVASVIFAIARVKPVTMQQALHALYIGMETECRIGLALFSCQSESTKGWYPTGIAGTIGAAAAAGILLHLNKGQMQSALGLAAASACGVRGTHGSMAGTLVPSLAAKNGFHAAELANNNFTCSYEALIGTNGLLHMITPHPDYEAALKDIGKYSVCAETSSKPYPYGYISFPVIDACRQAQQYSLNAKHITLEISPRAYLLGHNATPQTAEQAIVSLPYIAARTLSNVNQIYLPLHNPFVITAKEKKLMDKIELKETFSLQDDQAIVSLEYQNEVKTFLCQYAEGSTFRSMSEEAILLKYRRISNDTNAEKTIHNVLYEDSMDLYRDLIQNSVINTKS